MSTVQDSPTNLDPDDILGSDGKMMIDPFEVRMRFTTQLQHLSAAVASAQKAAHYALKYRDLDEDLHSCILEQLERVRNFSFLLGFC
jgi:CTD kinase subunit gamma